MSRKALLLLAVPALILAFLVGQVEAAKTGLTPKAQTEKQSAIPAEGPSPGHLFEVYTGIASYYHDKFQGRKTASGERYNKNAFTAAHRFLPFGTVVRVTNLTNGRHCLLHINDRGPVKKNWIIDLSRAAATRLNMLKRGIAPVQVEVVADKNGTLRQPGTAFFLKTETVRSRKEGEGKLAALRKASPKATAKSAGVFSEHTQNIPNTKIPGATTAKKGNKTAGPPLFVGLGPFSRYDAALQARGKLANKYPKSEILCLPLTVANTR